MMISTSNFSKPKTIACGLAVISVAALGSAYTAQYYFGLQPCELCLLQRIPYAVIIALGVAAYFINARAILALMGVAFIVGAALAGFHVGVEQHWWQGFTSCTSQMDFSDPAKLLEQIQHAPRARCDDIAWSFLGISMAGYNFVMSLILAGIAFYSASKKAS
jgi:disulfide bond formation protein DsbB